MQNNCMFFYIFSQVGLAQKLFTKHLNESFYYVFIRSIVCDSWWQKSDIVQQHHYEEQRHGGGHFEENIYGENIGEWIIYGSVYGWYELINVNSSHVGSLNVVYHKPRCKRLITTLRQLIRQRCRIKHTQPFCFFFKML